MGLLRGTLLCLCAGAVCAQSPDSAAIRGRVFDSSGAVVPGAEITIRNTTTGLKRTLASGPSGSYAAAELPLTGEYDVEAAKPGFGTRVAEHLRLRAQETAAVDFTLAPAAGAGEVVVTGTAEGVRGDSAQLGTSLGAQAIANPPSPGRKLTSLALLDAAVRPARGTGDLFLSNTLFAVGGNGRRQTSYVLDGSAGDDAWGRQTIFTNLPLAAIQEMTVLTNGFAADFGAGAVLNVNSRAGTNDVHGDVTALWRPGGVQARSPVAAGRAADRLRQASGSVSGPIVPDRTRFLLAAEEDLQDRDATITSPLARGNYTGHIRETIALARLDQQLSSRHSLAARFNFDRLSDTNPNDAVGGLGLPGVARTFRRAGYSAQVSETAAGAGAINEAHAAFLVASPVTQFQPATPSTQFVRPGVATDGESRIANLQNHQAQASDTVSAVRGAHRLRLGTALLHSSSGGVGQEFGSGFLLGQFTLKPGVLKPVPELTLADLQSFQQSFGNASYAVRQWIGSGFLADDWQLRPGLTLNLGLRYEVQSFSDDRRDIAPRIGFAWSPGCRTVVRGSYGLYYSPLRANLAAGWSINGPEGVFSFSAAPGQYGFPATFGPLAAFPPGAALPPRDITVRPGERDYLSRFFDVGKLARYPGRLLEPRYGQWSFGVERELASAWVLSVDYAGQKTTRIDRPLDLNAPSLFVRTAPGQVRSRAAADATRPIVPVNNGYRRILAVVNDGVCDYHALQVRLSRRHARRFFLLASYAYSHTIDTVDADVPAQDPADANLLGRSERGDSVLDQRHRAVFSAWWQPLARFTAGTVTSLASGRPYNWTTGTDNNGDGSTADRPFIDGAVVGRNVGRGTPSYDLGLFTEYALPLAAERLRVSLRAETFNTLNHANIVGRNGVYGNGAAPQASSGVALGGISNVDPGRQFQFLLRAQF